MKIKKTENTLCKKIVVFVVIIMVMAMYVPMTSLAAKKEGWVKGCYYVNGEKQKSTWIKDGSNTYYVDGNGKKITGWHKIKGAYYFFNQKGNNYQKGKKTGVKITKLSANTVTMGIDISTWQGNIDWNKVKEAGVDFVMIRIGYGKGRYGSSNCTMDNRFATYVEGAQSAGIPIGIYFYSYATSEKQALQEAEFTIKQLDGIPVSFPIAYDIEDAYILKKTTKAQRTSMAKTYMDTIAAAGYYPMFYCNQNWYNNYLYAEQIKDYDFWYARYTNQEPDITEYSYTIWQATSTQKLNGISENTVDIDFLYKDYSEIIETRTTAMKYGWYKESGDLQYYYKGKRKTDGWFVIGGYTYYLTNRGAKSGWQTISGNKYYFNSKCEMQTGFTRIGLKIYLFDKNGILQSETDEAGVTIDENNVCHIKKGWYKDNKGKYFYRYSNGSIAKNKWIKINGKKYFADSKGCRVTGFKKINGKRYYFKKNGQMVKGKTMTINGKKYTFKKNGQLK